MFGYCTIDEAFVLRVIKEEKINENVEGLVLVYTNPSCKYPI